LRLVVFSSASPDRLHHLLARLALDAPEVTVAGVLYETSRPGMTLLRRIRRGVKLLSDRQFIAYLWERGIEAVGRLLQRAIDAALRFIHAAPKSPNEPSRSLDALIAEWQASGVHFHVTPDAHAPDSLRFVDELKADLGVIYATRILKPSLFTVPRRGSINLHKHKLPDYRGCGEAGLWEMRDGRATQTVTVHRVAEQVDAGALIAERTFPIEAFDTLESVWFKSEVIGIDLIVDVLRAELSGQAVDRPQPAGGQLFKGWQPHQVRAVERSIRASRPRWKPQYSRPLVKLLARVCLLPLLAFRNHSHRIRRRFPIVVLFHHLTCDRPKHMAIPTAEFARHVRYLKRHYRVVSMSEAVGLLQKGEVDAPTVVLTLDDGYAENLLGLRAIAECEGVPVTICVCTQHVTEQSELAHDVARGERGFASMGWNDVRFLERHGVTIASHTRTHFNCGSDDYTTLVSEIAGSKHDLESELGHTVDLFAFPKGKPQNISSVAHEIAMKNYRVVMSAAGGSNSGPMKLPLHLRRYSHPDSLLELELQLQEILERPLMPASKLLSEHPPQNALGVRESDGGENVPADGRGARASDRRVANAAHSQELIP
jgi:peptidoglycan/xylan/chitin deacetylase (PgdA/CDA1 family)